MKKLAIIIMFLIAVIGFQINASHNKDLSYNASLSTNLGILDYRLQPFERQAVDFLYSRLYFSSKDSQKLASGSRQENLAIRFNQRLDSLTGKYLDLPNQSEESKYAASLECSEKDYTKQMKYTLDQIMTPEDYEYYKAITKSFKETHSISKLNDMRQFLNSYPEVCKDFLIGYMLFEDERYKAEFEKRYWKDIEHDAYVILKGDSLIINNETEYFYIRHQDRFITKFSAKSARDDMAEAFYYFINADKPDSQQIWAQKVRFFYEFDELSLLRQNAKKD